MTGTVEKSFRLPVPLKNLLDKVCAALSQGRDNPYTRCMALRAVCRKINNGKATIDRNNGNMCVILRRGEKVVHISIPPMYYNLQFCLRHELGIIHIKSRNFIPVTLNSEDYRIILAGCLIDADTEFSQIKKYTERAGVDYIASPEDESTFRVYFDTLQKIHGGA